MKGSRKVKGGIPALLFSSLTACSSGLSPLHNHAEAGKDAYAIFVGDGPTGAADLFAVRGDGGPAFQITYTDVVEAGPALSPDGVTVAFLRGRTMRDTVPGAVWVLNLMNGAERELDLPQGAAPPDHVGWARAGDVLFVRAGAEVYRLAAPPASAGARLARPDERLTADSSFSVVLGDPPFARVLACGGSLCAEGANGPPTPFVQEAHDAVRWGPDSLGYLAGDELIVRSVGPGRSRRVLWRGAPKRPREFTFFPGRPPA